MTPDLNAMALFVRVIEHKSFSAASRYLDIPISTVSRKVSELEKSLGVRLIERSTRKLRLTELGKEYYQYCRRGLEEFETGALVLNDRQSEVAGTLRLSIPPNVADVLITPVVCAFQQSYPRTVVKILVTERYVDLIEDGVDIALRVGKLEDSSLIARHLLTYRHRLVASPDYINRYGEPKHPGELGSHRIIAFDGWHGPVHWEFENEEQHEKVEIDSVLSINEMSGVQYAVEASQGIAEIPSIICNEALENGRLVEVMRDWRFLPVTLSAVYPSKRNTSRLVRLFMDFCSEKMTGGSIIHDHR